jgi:hypothetical protein
MFILVAMRTSKSHEIIPHGQATLQNVPGLEKLRVRKYKYFIPVFNPEDGGTRFLQNFGKYLPEYTASSIRRIFPHCMSFATLSDF